MLGSFTLISRASCGVYCCLYVCLLACSLGLFVCNFDLMEERGESKRRILFVIFCCCRRCLFLFVIKLCYALFFIFLTTIPVHPGYSSYITDLYQGNKRTIENNDEEAERKLPNITNIATNWDFSSLQGARCQRRSQGSGATGITES